MIITKKRLLLVEDEAITAMVLKRNLELIGYEVAKPVASGMEAIEAVRQNSFDAILMDIRLVGNMDGIEAAQKISAMREIPIIFVSGYIDDEMKARAKALKPVAYLVKPVTPDDIAPILDKLFK